MLNFLSTQKEDNVSNQAYSTGMVHSAGDNWVHVKLNKECYDLRETEPFKLLQLLHCSQ